jgi:hypothetical protein
MAAAINLFILNALENQYRLIRIPKIARQLPRISGDRWRLFACVGLSHAPDPYSERPVALRQSILVWLPDQIAILLASKFGLTGAAISKISAS